MITIKNWLAIKKINSLLLFNKTFSIILYILQTYLFIFTKIILNRLS